MKKRQGFVFNHPSEEKINQVIRDFTKAGWEFFGKYELGKSVVVEFNWNEDTEPVIPDGYKQ